VYRLLPAPGGESFALAGTATANKARRERSGNPIELITEAERAGGGKAIWAVVAPIRSDLLVIDLDRCAGQVWPRLHEVLGDYSATTAYLARSGSPDSLHVILRCPSPASDRGIREFLADLRRHLNLSARRIDVLSPGHLLRLPGSASLKPGGHHCTPVDDDLTPITAVRTADRLRTALGSNEPGPVQASFARHDDGWCVPGYTAQRHPGGFGVLDVVLAVAFLAFLSGEATADQQQWEFHKRKTSGQTSTRFCTTGLFHYSRHPNYFFEQAQWWVIYLFGAVAAGSILQPTIVGAVLLTLLFVGSTKFTESLTLSKYPEYADYQHTTSAQIPLPPKRRRTAAV